MGTLIALLGFGSLIAALIFLVMGIVSLIRKNENVNKYFKFGGIAALCFIVLLIFGPDTDSTSSANDSPEEPKITAEDLKTKAKTIDYAQLEKNTSRYEGELVKYTGQILEITEYNDDGNYTHLRLAVTETDFGWDSDDAIYVEYDGYTDFVEDDIVTIYGEIYGPYSYTSVAGWEITIPCVIAQIIE